MTIGEMLALKPGAKFYREGILKTMTRVAIIPESREDAGGNLIDLSYVEFIYNDGALYHGPTIRLNLEICEFSKI